MKKQFLDKMKEVGRTMGQAVMNKNQKRAQFDGFYKQKEYAELQLKEMQKQMKSLQKKMKDLRNQSFSSYFSTNNISNDPVKVVKNQNKSNNNNDESAKRPEEEKSQWEWSKAKNKWDEGIQSMKKTGENMEQHIKKIKDNIKPPDFSSEYKKVEQTVHEQAEKLKKISQQQKEKVEELSKKGQEELKEQTKKLEGVKQALKDGVSKGISQKAEFANTLLKKMFWRMTMLIILASFAYGIGSNVPREIRLYLSSRQSVDEKKTQAKAE